MTQPDATQPTADELGAALSRKHRDFADIYLTSGLNVSAAGQAAGYKNYWEGHRLMRREDVSAYVRARLDESGLTGQEIIRRLEFFASSDMRDFLTVAPSERSYWVRASESEEVRGYAKRRGLLPDAVENYDVSGLVGSENVAQTEDGVLMVCIRKVDAEVTIDWRRAEQGQALGRIKKLKIQKDGAVEFELHDPTRALELLGKAHKLFTDRTELVGDPNAPLQVQITRRIVTGGEE